MKPPSLVDRLLAVCNVLERAGIPYAVGGALALAYYAEPRATQDIDLNIFLPEGDGELVFEALGDLGLRATPEQRRRVAAEGQVRLDLDGTMLDLFFAGLPFHEQCRERARQVPFDGGAIRVLSAEDLVVFKVLFNRTKDWTDISAVLSGTRIDTGYVLGWLDEMVGRDDTARRRFATLAASEAD
ncbi:MAG: nucleotidyltransferase family protein [Dehalococcoidia bacterium]